VRQKEMRLMFWNAVIKTINVTMVFGVPPIVTFAVLVGSRAGAAFGSIAAAASSSELRTL
jgi:hypothetical protein